MKREISIPDLNIWRNSIDSVIRSIKKLESGDEVDLDARTNADFKPQGIVMLTLLCQLIYNETGNKVGLVGLKQETNDKLMSLGFFEFPFVRTNNKNNIFSIRIKKGASLTDTKLTLIKHPSDIVIFIDRINEMLNISAHKAEPFRNIPYLIAELCDNSLEHSKGHNVMGECFCAVQKYVYSGKNATSICIGDIGLGIRQHLRLVHTDIYDSDNYCIQQVLDGLTGRQDGSGGFGIPYIKDEVNKNKGEFHIRSGRGLVEFGLDNGIRKYGFITSFPGTQSLIIIK